MVQEVSIQILENTKTIKRNLSLGLSIYGTKFVDENFRLSHKSAGWVSMAK
jgi:hypothetical protein